VSKKKTRRQPELNAWQALDGGSMVAAPSEWPGDFRKSEDSDSFSARRGLDDGSAQRRFSICATEPVPTDETQRYYRAKVAE